MWASGADDRNNNGKKNNITCSMHPLYSFGFKFESVHVLSVKLVALTPLCRFSCLAVWRRLSRCRTENNYATIQAEGALIKNEMLDERPEK